MAYAASQGASIAAWYLVVPLNATKEIPVAWFYTLTWDSDYPCGWMGLPQLNGLAAKYQNVTVGVDVHAFRAGMLADRSGLPTAP